MLIHSNTLRTLAEYRPCERRWRSANSRGQDAILTSIPAASWPEWPDLEDLIRAPRLRIAGEDSVKQPKRQAPGWLVRVTALMGLAAVAVICLAWI